MKRKKNKVEKKNKMLQKYIKYRINAKNIKTKLQIVSHIKFGKICIRKKKKKRNNEMAHLITYYLN